MALSPATDRKMARLLVVRFSALGDVAMTLPVVYSLARKYPDVRIDFVTTPFFGRLFLDAPENVTVHGIDLKKDYAGAKGTLRLLGYLRNLRPDCVVDLHNVLRTWIIDNYFRLRGVKVVMVDKMRRGRKEIIRDKMAQPPFISRYADTFGRAGFPVTPDFKGLFPHENREVYVDGIAVSHPAVGIAPFARYFNKIYPLDKMEKVAGLLASKGVSVYLFGGRGDEAGKLEDVASRIEGCVSVAGRMPIEKELELMSRMDVMVSMDSANHHMASLVGVPVVSVWGSTTPGCGFMGYGQPDSNAVCLNLACQPCTIAGSPQCPRGDFNCMNGIEPEIIVEKILGLAR